MGYRNGLPKDPSILERETKAQLHRPGQLPVLS